MKHSRLFQAKHRFHLLLAGVLAFGVVSTSSAKGPKGGGKPPPPPAEETLLLSKCCFGEVYVSSEDPSQLVKVWDKSIVNHSQAVWLPGGNEFAFRGNTRLDGENWIPGLYLGSSLGADPMTLLESTDSFRISSADSSLSAVAGACGNGTPTLYFLAGIFDPNAGFGSYREVHALEPFATTPAATLTRVTTIPGLGKSALDVSRDGRYLALVTIDPATNSQSLEIRDLCDANAPVDDAPVLWSWTFAELGFSSIQRLNQMDISVNGVLAISVLSNPPEGCQAYCEATIWLIDPFTRDTNGLPALQQITGPGGSQPGIERGISPGWSPDGTQLMFSSGTQKKTRMFLLDFTTDRVESIANFSNLTLDWKPD